MAQNTENCTFTIFWSPDSIRPAVDWSLPEAPDSSKVIKDAKDAHVSDVNTFGIFGDPVITFDGAEPTVVEQAARLARHLEVLT